MLIAQLPPRRCWTAIALDWVVVLYIWSTWFALTVTGQSSIVLSSAIRVSGLIVLSYNDALEWGIRVYRAGCLTLSGHGWIALRGVGGILVLALVDS